MRRIESPDAPLEDDVTLLLLRPNGLAATVPWRDRLLAPFRILKALARSALRGGKPVPWPEISVVSLGGAMINAFNRLWRCDRNGRNAR